MEKHSSEMLKTYKFCRSSTSCGPKHAVEPREDLKTQMSYLLSQAQELFDNIETLNIIDDENSCIKSLDEWKATLHSKIDQIYCELQMHLKQLTMKIREEKDPWKQYLRSQVQHNVIAILNDQLQEKKPEMSQIEAARCKYDHLQEVFHRFHNQPLLSMTCTIDNRLDLIAPVIVCSKFLVDELQLIEDFQNENKLLESKKNATGFELNDSCNHRLTFLDPDRTSLENKKQTTIDTSKHMFNETLLNASISTSLTKTEVNDRQDSQQKYTLNKTESQPTELTSCVQSMDFRNRDIDSIDDGNQFKINLRFRNITDDDVDIVVNNSLKNTQLTRPVTKLDISFNRIGDQGMEYLSHTLKLNATLTDLDISHNKIGVLGMCYLKDALKINKSLKILNLGYNRVKSKGIKHLSDAIQVNNTLLVLKLNSCHIQDDGAKYLGESLKYNQSIYRLELAANGIGPTGALYLSDALQANKTLVDLDLARNYIADDGVKHLSCALLYNTTLKTLDLTFNYIENVGAKFISATIWINRTLTALNLQQNPLGTEGIQYLHDIVGYTQISFDLENNDHLPSTKSTAAGYSKKKKRNLEHIDEQTNY